MLLATALAASLISTAAAQGPDRTSQAAGVRARDGTCLFTDPCDGQRINMRPFFVFQNSCGDEYVAERDCGETGRAPEPTLPPFIETHFDTDTPTGSATSAYVDECGRGVNRAQQGQGCTNTCGVSYLLGRHCGVSLARNAAPTVTSSVGKPTLTDEPPPTVTLGTPTLTAVSRRAAKAKAADAAKAASKA